MTQGALCPEHTRLARAAYDAKRGKDRQWYANRTWRKLRKLKLSRNPLCERCPTPTSATEVHHKIDRHARPDLSLVMDNLESLCKPCHSSETARRLRAAGIPPKI